MTGKQKVALHEESHAQPSILVPMTTEVVKRDGRRECVSFDKIQSRIDTLRLLPPALTKVDVVKVTQRVVQGVYDGVHTSELDDLTSETAAALSATHPEYASLAARVAVSNLHKTIRTSMDALYPYLSGCVATFVRYHSVAINERLDLTLDYQYDIFGFKTLLHSYLLRDEEGRPVECPQMMLMRVALGIHVEAGGTLPEVFDTYGRLSRLEYTHATPTMFNSGTRTPSLASCFLLPIADDSIQGIMDTNTRCALISKSAGGIGFSVSNVRASGAPIRSTGGRASGILPMLRCFNATARYVDQGGGKRKGAFCAYLEPWHPDVRVFLSMKKNHGAEELRARDLFYALWIPDLFMRRVEEDAEWTLFCPSTAPDLVDLHGVAFEEAYVAYEKRGVGMETVRAQDIWFAILDAQMESGVPFMLYKDAANAKSNQRNLGTIRSSNLCTEIMQYSSRDEVAVCNLASVSLPAHVTSKGTFDHAKLRDTVRAMVCNLNRVIDVNEYACDQARRSNLRHRPIGMGVQGLADVFARLRMAYEDEDARALNRDIFETMYFSAVEMSCELASKHGSYDTFDGSPASYGDLQFDLWGDEGRKAATTSGRWDWGRLKADVLRHGMRNSLLVAPMPTASTAQIMGNNEAFEPFTSNVYVRRVLAGEFICVNKHLVHALEQHGMWTEDVRDRILAADGSVQHVECIPDDVKRIFKTAWEMKMRTLIDMAADRGVFVDQSQSLNLFVADPNHKKLSSMHFYAWKRGLKTGMYYLRTRAATEAVKVTIPVAVTEEVDRARRATGGSHDEKADVETTCLACSA